MWTSALLAAAVTGALVWWWHHRRLASLRADVERLERKVDEVGPAATAAASARLEGLLDSFPEGVVVLDPAGRIRHANAAALRLLEPATAVKGQTILEAFRLPAVQDLLVRVRGGDGAPTAEVLLPGQSQRQIEAQAAAFHGGGTDEGSALIVFRDVTELRRLENYRREFVANVSHELRTPLSMIKGFVETLLGGAKDDPAVAERFLQTIERHADRLGLLLEDLLTLSQLESGHVALALRTVPLREAAGQVLEDFQARAREREVRLANDVGPELVVDADAERLQQVLSNLVDNAIKYGRSGGLVTVGAREDGTFVVVSVRDDGPGIPAEARERVFERFFRADRGRSREAGGTGLGLAIVKHIVQSHGGRVWVESEPGQGANFCFTLPRAGAAESGGAATANNRSPMTNG